MKVWQHSSTPLTLNGTPAAMVFIAPSRIVVHEIGAVQTTVMVSATNAPVWKATKTVNSTAGSAGDGGVLTFSKTQAVGTGVFDTTSTIFPYTLNAGDHISIDDTTPADTSGAATFYVRYELAENVKGNRTTYMTEST
ncbi:MAG TPA: hypothetical protein ACFYEK_10945 [Candidatus Wunengus sp. YC60]|uniref:hypothetical protein n=1 Tax=Candidatus Wunengus sp. YC60 TaxID=3367697 RepID=UPI004028A7D3